MILIFFLIFFWMANKTFNFILFGTVLFVRKLERAFSEKVWHLVSTNIYHIYLWFDLPKLFPIHCTYARTIKAIQQFIGYCRKKCKLSKLHFTTYHVCLEIPLKLLKVMMNIYRKFQHRSCKSSHFSAYAHNPNSFFWSFAQQD